MATTWDPANHNAGITLTNGNLTATGSGGNQTGIATGSITTAQRFYWEVTINAQGGSTGVGLGNSSFATASFLGGDGNSLCYFFSGSVFNGGSGIASIASFTTGAIIGVAYDFNAKLVWFTLNGTTWNNDVIGNQNPAVGSQVGGINPPALAGDLFPAYSVGNTEQVTGKFTNAGLAYSIPTGFSTFDTASADTLFAQAVM